MKNYIREILQSAGYRCESSNRDTRTKFVNMNIQNGSSIVSVAPIGKHFVRGDKRYLLSVTVTLNEKTLRMSLPLSKFADRSVDVFTVFSYMTTLIEKLKGEEKGCCKKCDGSGFIAEFSYYAKGVCFDCLGTGNSI